MNYLVMIIVGTLAGTIAARLMKGTTYGIIPNMLLGILGAVVGGVIFDALGFSPGAVVVRSIQRTFDVTLPRTFIGSLISATLGAILVLWVAGLLGGKKKS